MAVILNSATDTAGLPDGPLRDQAYNALDCCITAEVLRTIEPKLDSTTAATYEFSRLLQPPVLDMMLRGILIDQQRRSMVTEEMRQRIKKLEANLLRLIREGCEETEHKFNWRSYPDLKWLFYEVLGLPPQKNHDGGITVDAGALTKLARYTHARPYVSHLLAMRDAGKMLGVLVSPLEATGRMHCTYGIAGTEVGRFSSYTSAFGQGMNLQNISPEMRYPFIADAGKKMAYVDKAQAESRAVGAKIFVLFGDSTYLDAVESADCHTAVATMVWSHIRSRSDADQLFYGVFSYRNMAKRLGHATNYLGTPAELSDRFHIPKDVVVDFQTRYFIAFPGIRRWHEWVLEQLTTKGFLVSLTGRKRYFLGRRDDNHTFGEAVAYDPQETVARLLNQGMLRVWLRYIRGELPVELLAQIHDAILVQYPEQQEDIVLPEVMKSIKTTMVLTSPDGVKRDLTLPCDAKVGWNWGSRYKQAADGSKYEFDPDGMTDYKGHDNRFRFFRPQKSILDQPFDRTYPPLRAAA